MGARRDTIAARATLLPLVVVLTWVKRILGRADAITMNAAAGSRATGTRRMPLLAAFVLFAVVVVVSLAGIGEVSFSPLWLVPVLAGAVAATAINGLEYLVVAGSVGAQVTWRDALRIAVLGSAANLLPVPGAVVIRTQGLRGLGVNASSAMRSNVAMGVMWISVAAVLAGAAMWLFGSVWAAAGTLAVGVAGVFVAGALSGRPRWFSVRAAPLELGFVVVSAVRAYAALRVIGIDVPIMKAVIVPLAGALGSAFGILPGGLGLREALAGLLATTVDLSSAGAALAASLDRIVGLVVLALVTALALILDRREPREVGVDP